MSTAMIGSQPTAAAAITAPHPTAPRTNMMIPCRAARRGIEDRAGARLQSAAEWADELERQAVRDLHAFVTLAIAWVANEDWQKKQPNSASSPPFIGAANLTPVVPSSRAPPKFSATPRSQ